MFSMPLRESSLHLGRPAMRLVRSAAPGQADALNGAVAKAMAAVVEQLEGRTLLSAVYGAVFVATNANNTRDRTQPANEVVMYNRSVNGALTLVGRYKTGGQGSGPSVRLAGDGLGSSHSVQLSMWKKFLFVTNAGSDNVSVFRVSTTGLKLVDLEPTAHFPNSITQFNDRVYVLGGAGDGSISGYEFNTSTGDLSPLSDSTRKLNANQNAVRPDVMSNPSQVSFTPDGKQLVVSIKDGPAAGVISGLKPTGPGRLLVFNLDNTGRPIGSFRQTNLGNRGPFGFSFDSKGNLLTTHFVGGPTVRGPTGSLTPSSSVSSFRLNSDGSLTAITGNLPNTQLDSCWLENNGTYAYSANYGSSTISSYLIGANGNLTLLKAVAGFAADRPGGNFQPQGATPVDIRISPNGKFCYDVLPGSGAIGGWRINSDGSLTKLGEFGKLKPTVSGDHAKVEFGPGGCTAGIDIIDYDTPFDPAVATRTRR